MTQRQVRARHPGDVIGHLGETGRFARGVRRSLHRERKCDDECNDARQPVHVSFTIALAASVGNAPMRAAIQPERQLNASFTSTQPAPHILSQSMTPSLRKFAAGAHAVPKAQASSAAYT